VLPTSISKQYFFLQRNLVSRSNKKPLADRTDRVFTYERRNWSAYQHGNFLFCIWNAFSLVRQQKSGFDFKRNLLSIL